VQHLRQRLFKSALLAGLILPLAACSIAPATAVVPTTAPTTAASIAASANLNLAAAPTTAPTAQRIAAPPAVPRSLSGTGEVRAVRTADLAFLVAGQVAELRVREGDTVTAGQVLAVLDLRPFDQQIRQAEAAMAGAEAALVGLSDPPRAADRRALEAQVRQAEVALEQARAGQGQDTRAAASGVASAQVALQQTRDQLSAAKSNAQLQMEQAANALRNAQDAYSRLYWDNRDLERLPGDLPQALIDAEAAALRAVQDGESALAQAQLALEQAQQQERTGVQAAEEQLRQALVPTRWRSHRPGWTRREPSSPS
jgi:multidrug efflux pump subunit AcrA (membrane-fusion protein)